MYQMTAQVALQQAQGGASPQIMNIAFLVLICVIFYFFFIRPQAKRQKELNNFRKSLAKGDKVVTTGGIYGKIVELGDYYVLLEVDNNVKIKVDKSTLVKDMSAANQAK